VKSGVPCVGSVLCLRGIGLAAGMLFPLIAIPDIPYKEKGAAAVRERHPGPYEPAA
jgi:hypothetical protein